MKSQSVATQNPAGIILLLALSAAQALLALFQWIELLLVRSGGSSVCNLNQVLSCETVWNSPLASRIHRLTGIPVAGLGLLWAIVAFSLSLLLVQRLLSKGNTETPIVALRLVASIGAAVCLALALWSALSGSICLTCVGTYVLILAFTFVAFRMLTGPLVKSAVKPALAWMVALGAVFYAILWAAGFKTPRPSESNTISAVEAATPTKSSDQVLKLYINSLGQPEKQLLADSIEFYKRAPAVTLADVHPRFRFGPTNAPVQIVDFTDIRCPHCRRLEESLKNLKRIAPAGAISIESRQFPLDSECNQVMQMTDGTGVRCLAAKVQICLEQSPEYWDIRSKLFAEQENLTQERIWDLAGSGSISRAALKACVTSAETTAKLNDDIRYALRYRPSGTPLVLVNGRQGPPFDGFLLAMVMAKGDPNDASFAALPAPNIATQ